MSFYKDNRKIMQYMLQKNLSPRTSKTQLKRRVAELENEDTWPEMVELWATLTNDKNKKNEQQETDDPDEPNEPDIDEAIQSIDAAMKTGDIKTNISEPLDKDFESYVHSMFQYDIPLKPNAGVNANTEFDTTIVIPESALSLLRIQPNENVDVNSIIIDGNSIGHEDNGGGYSEDSGDDNGGDNGGDSEDNAGGDSSECSGESDTTEDHDNDNDSDSDSDDESSNPILLSNSDPCVFFEQYISQHSSKLSDFELFCCTSLSNISSLAPNYAQQWRDDIIAELFKTIGQDELFAKRVEASIYTHHINKFNSNIFDYAMHIGGLVVLFDKKETFNLNSILYRDLANKALNAITVKKFTLSEMIERTMRGKVVSHELLQMIQCNIARKQNLRGLVYLIRMYNTCVHPNMIITEDLFPCIQDDSQDIQQRIDGVVWPKKHTMQTVLYKDPEDERIYVFNIDRLWTRISTGNNTNPITNRKFTPEFIDVVQKYGSNTLRCIFCKDNKMGRPLKTMFEHPTAGPIMVQFCSIECFRDTDWKNSVLCRMC